MNCFLFTVFIIAAPLASANYGSTSSGSSHLSSASSGGLEELAHVASGGAHTSGGSYDNAHSHLYLSPHQSAQIGQVEAQLQALNANPAYRNLKNSDAIEESLAQTKFSSHLRQGKVNLVAPNVVDQGVYRSLLVPTGENNHQVIATQPLPPIIVNQPPQPPTHVGGGPAAVVKAAPVIYKIKPSVIYQQEVINKVPTPLSLNPVYVKVYKPGKKVDAPHVRGVHKNYQAQSYSEPATYSAPAPASYDTAPTSSYSSAPAYNYEAAPAASYGGETSYNTAAAGSNNYDSAPSSSGYSAQSSY